MKSALIKLIVNIISFFLVIKFISGIQVDRWQTVIVAAIVLTLVNAILKPIIILFTLPLNILSLGLFTFVVNGFMFYLVSKLVRGFNIVNFWTAIAGAFIFSIVSVLLNMFIGPHEKVKSGFYRHDYSRNKYHDIIDVEAKEEKIL
ncbi:MAG: phage holin family protein [Elusimicrobiota bacterium]|nr:phage holin family protein [Elusimicrobiota bacterium]